MKKLLGVLILGMFAISLAIAANGAQLRDGSGEMHEAVVAAGGQNGSAQQVMAHMREKMNVGDERYFNSKGLKLRKIANDEVELMMNQTRVRSRLNISEEGNGTMIRARMSNGRNAEIKIMPETASARALQRLRLKNCNETRNCTIELKEVGQGDQARAAYELRAEKNFRVFGLFKSRSEVTTQIDAETGEEIRTRKPWWSFLASEESEE